MSGAHDIAANSNAAVCLMFGHNDGLANDLLGVTIHDSNDDDAISAEIEGRRGVNIHLL